MCVTFLYTNPTAVASSTIPYKVILVNNRDEVFARPTALPKWHDGDRTLYAADDVASGTWLAIGRNGAIGNLLNVPTGKNDPFAKSRGSLAIDVLTDPQSFSVAEDYNEYNGFKLLRVDEKSLCHVYSNRGSAESPTPPGFRGYGNNDGTRALFRKVTESVPVFEAVANEHARTSTEALHTKMLAFLSRSNKFLPDSSLKEHYEDDEKVLEFSSVFINFKDVYGTRSQSVITVDCADRVTVTQKTLLQPHMHDGKTDTQTFSFDKLFD